MHIQLQSFIRDFLDQNRQSGFLYEVELDRNENVCLVRVRIKQRQCTCNTADYDRIFQVANKQQLERVKEKMQRLSDEYFLDPRDPTLM